VEAKVRSYFSDIPVMIAIAKCESNFRQFTDAGNVLHGGLGGQMIGVFQFHDASHRTTATALGYDIDMLEGNLHYARHLYTRSGTDPWISSFDCWNSQVPLAPGSAVVTTIVTGPFTTDLRFGMEHPDVLLLQQYLNRAGYALASSGPGSPGNETIKFGNLTRAAVRRFQCAQGIACSGDEYTTGYGLAGERTRNALFGAPQSVSASVTTPVPQAATIDAEKAAKIAALKAQIAELMQLVAALQAQLAQNR
jgi:hypothetical protein